ncbi:MAG TPA: clostripain-related cysteine peptidase [Thermoanaerobaculia bacterium]|nr:clostripain-related cysteine peptidase [Thermoanaerobaculia bacterium]
MLVDRGNPYTAGAPEVLHLDWDDFRFELSTINRAALGRRAKWTVLAYLAADCDLARWMFADLLEMKSVGSNDDVHVLALFDGPLLADSFIARLNAGTPLGQDLVMRFNELRTSDAKLLAQVLGLAQAFPAEHRLVILGGHGSGWKGVLQDQGLGRRYLQQPGRLVLPGPGEACDAELRRCQVAAQDELNGAIERNSAAAPGSIDVIAFDACYMGNLESVGAGFSDHARWLVLAEDQWPGEGFDYRTLVHTLRTEPDITPEMLARRLVADSAHAYRADAQRGTPVTLAAIDAARLAPLAGAFVGFAQSLDPNNAVLLQVLNDALADTWRSKKTGLADLKGLAQQLLARPVPSSCADAARTLVQRFDEAVVACCGGRTPSSTNGLSIYAPPPDDFDPDYIPFANGLPHGLGIWAWALGGYYLQVLGHNPGNPLIASLEATMRAAMQSGDWPPR